MDHHIVAYVLYSLGIGGLVWLYGLACYVARPGAIDREKARTIRFRNRKQHPEELVRHPNSRLAYLFAFVAVLNYYRLIRFGRKLFHRHLDYGMIDG